MSQPLIRPSDGELAILRVLWGRGPSTVRDVHAALSKDRDMGYTTVLKLMQIMVEKGLVTRDESTRTHVYQAAQEEAPTQACLLKDLLQKAFEGSAASLVVRALSEAPANEADLDAIQATLDRLRKERS
ncbi:MAG TPA: BlaI/MecI/CopY family transcriptional regulator [Holophaga sp.]|jgi:BlaI family transcriptional regulator, penicillinase repressor|nr:BlaI/MecI/CopY family transcriptional regulator [Holophaga sp.]HQL47720.1 BlaI/MecI/CopY family transcriptional regulator [Holophaga sp.]